MSPALGGVAALIASIAGIIGFLWSLMRLSVTFPAILATRSFGIAQSWRATKGNSARLLGYWILIFILMMIAGGVYFSIFLADFFPLYGEIFEAGADQAAAQEVNRKMLELQREYYDMGNREVLAIRDRNLFLHDRDDGLDERRGWHRLAVSDRSRGPRR